MSDLVDTINKFGITDIHIPKDGYELIRQIKEYDGRIAYLTDWADEIKDFIKAANPQRFDGKEITGDDGIRRLRIVRRKAGSSRKFNYQLLVDAKAPEVYSRYVKVVPPPYPVDIRLAGASRGKSHEWHALAAVGTKAEKAETLGRDQWKHSSPQVITEGLAYLLARTTAYKPARDSLRQELRKMAAENGWENGLLGRSDGRLLLTKARPSFTRQDNVSLDDLARAFPAFVTRGTKKATVAVGFYVAGQELEDDE